MRRIIINSLSKLGYQDIIEANDGQEALQKLADDSTINFVITDWHMPILTGPDFMRQIRENERTKNMPVLVVVVQGAQHDISEALWAQVNDYIIKPFTPTILQQKINRILSNVNI